MNRLHESQQLLTYASPDDPWWKRRLIHVIEQLSGKKKIIRLYDRVVADLHEDISFWELALKQLEVDLNYNAKQLEKVPPHGPVVFIANHPFGVLDGLIICYLVHIVRPHFRILTNSVLCHAEHVQPYTLPIDFKQTREAIRTNITTKQRAIETLKNDGAIVIFPAGGVATSEKLFGKASDLDWKVFTAKLIQSSKATVIPIYFHGQNSRLFQVVSQFSMTLRLSLLMHEVKNKIGKSVHLRIGDPMEYDELAHIKNRQELMHYLRSITLGLRWR